MYQVSNKQIKKLYANGRTSSNPSTRKISFLGSRFRRTITHHVEWKSIYIFVFVSGYTKWVEAVAVPYQSASTAAKALINSIIYRFGIPRRIHSDQGANFESQLYADLCRCLGIQKSHTTPYHPMSNGLTERFNKTIKELLRIAVSEVDIDRWDENLEQVLFAIRASISSSTKFSPAKLVYGCELRLPIDLCRPISESSLDQGNYHIFVKKFKKELEDTFNIVNSNLSKSGQSMEQNYNKKLCVNNFKIGDMVLVKELTRSKLDPLFEGPFEVIKSKHPVYTIRNCQDSSDERRIHHNRLFKLK
ncbi:Retrovirus-related Pol polyprotein [Thelohanellus kitauei]|uniref:Retrovirus-related Pol polyprotein n=1 Tax=Thelohanellus kitauei TaxID=669202 RepID=A0A0C2JCG3_THEKT|nr:Retrovirus-related Pol polyprotein [Thelohanellus kitauei]